MCVLVIFPLLMPDQAAVSVARRSVRKASLVGGDIGAKASPVGSEC